MKQAPLRLRTATFADAGAIRRLNERNGMDVFDEAVRRECWEAYPFASAFEGVPLGWVLETADGLVVGNLDNIHMLYEMNGQRLRGVLAAGWAVDVDHRGDSLPLMTTFFRQKGVDLYLGVSASPTASRILTAMKIARIPIPQYGTPCFWPVNSRAFARAGLLRKSIQGAALLAWPAGLALRARDIFRGSGRGRMASSVRRLSEFDERFDGLWQRISRGAVRLRAVRGRSVLDWRFGRALRAGQGTIVVSEKSGTLLGYAVLLKRIGPEQGMSLYDVADLQADADDPAVFRDLLLGSLQSARDEGVDAVKLMTGAPYKRSVADALRPYTYSLPFWQQYFKVASPDLGAALSAPDNWDFSLFDTY